MPEWLTQCVAFQGLDIELALASPSLESLSLSPIQLSAGGGMGGACAFPKLTALTYACETSFTAMFEELPVLDSLRFDSFWDRVS